MLQSCAAVARLLVVGIAVCCTTSTVNSIRFPDEEAAPVANQHRKQAIKFPTLRFPSDSNLQKDVDPIPFLLGTYFCIHSYSIIFFSIHLFVRSFIARYLFILLHYIIISFTYFYVKGKVSLFILM